MGSHVFRFYFPYVDISIYATRRKAISCMGFIYSLFTVEILIFVVSWARAIDEYGLFTPHQYDIDVPNKFYRGGIFGFIKLATG